MSLTNTDGDVKIQNASYRLLYFNKLRKALTKFCSFPTLLQPKIYFQINLENIKFHSKQTFKFLPTPIKHSVTKTQS